MGIGRCRALIVAALLLSGSAVAADRPAFCAQLDQLSPIYATLCKPVSIVPPITPNAPQTVTIEIACGGWSVYRNGAALIVVCPGRQAPVGAAPLYCAGTAAQCGR